jgi:hypothetical protein
VKNIRRLRQIRKQKPGVTYASSGIGGAGHLAGELLKEMAKIDIVHVPYKGGGPAMQGFLGNQVDSFFATPISSISADQVGQARAIATTGSKRAKLMSDVPTVAEQGFPATSAQLVRLPRARRHAEGDRRPSRARDRQGAANLKVIEQMERPARRPRHDARRVRALHQARVRHLGQGGEGSRNQAAVATTSILLVDATSCACFTHRNWSLPSGKRKDLLWGWGCRPLQFQGFATAARTEARRVTLDIGHNVMGVGRDAQR